MNKSAVFWLEFFSKHFAPGPSSVELQSTLETLIAMFAYAMKEKKLVLRTFCKRPRGNESRSLSHVDDWRQAEK